MTLSVTLSIWTAAFTPDEVTQEMGVRPDRTAMRGIDRIPARTQPAANGWHLHEECNDRTAAEDVVIALIKRVRPAREALLHLQERDPKLAVHLTIYFGRGRAAVSCHLSVDLVAELSKLNASVFIDCVDLSTGRA